MVQIPIDDQNAIQMVLGNRVHGAQGNIVEQTETCCIMLSSMMTRGPDKGKSIIDLTGHDVVNSVEETPDSQSRRIIGFRSGFCIGIQVKMRFPNGTGNQFDIGRIVNPLNFLPVGKARGNLSKMASHIGLFDHRVDGFQPRGTFRMIA